MSYQLAHQIRSISRLRSLAFRKNCLVVAGEYGGFNVYNLDPQSLSLSIKFSLTKPETIFRSVDISLNDQIAYLGDSKGEIYKVDFKQQEPIFITLLRRHNLGSSVSTIVCFNEDSFISGAWDATAIVWKNESPKIQFSNYHKHAVSCCPIQDGLYLTSSQSGLVVLRQDHNEPDAIVTHVHQDIVRKIVQFMPFHAVTCSNDGRLGFWAIIKPTNNTTRYSLSPIRVDNTDDFAQEASSFIYDCDATVVNNQIYVVYTQEESHLTRLAVFDMETCQNNTQTIVTKVTKLHTQTIHASTNTVWCTKLIPTPDETAILIASYDGLVQIFSTIPEKFMNTDQLAEAQIDCDQANQANQQDQIDPQKLPSILESSDPKFKVKGKVQLFRDIDNKGVLVYEWNGSNWQFIGNMTGGPRNQPDHHQPDQPQSDHSQPDQPQPDHPRPQDEIVFDIKLSYRPESVLKFVYKLGEDPEKAAEKFCRDQNLELYHMYPIMKKLCAGVDHNTDRRITCEVESLSPIKCYMPQGWGKANVEAPVRKILSMDLLQPEGIKRLNLQQRMVLEGAISVLDSPNPKVAGPKAKDVLAVLMPFDWTPWEPKSDHFAFYDLLRIALYHDEAADLYRRSCMTKGPLSVFQLLTNLANSETAPTRTCILKFLTNVCRWPSLRGFFVEHTNTILDFLKSAQLKPDTSSALGPLLLNHALAIQGYMSFIKTETQRTSLLAKTHPVRPNSWNRQLYEQFYCFLVDNLHSNVIPSSFAIQALAVMVDCFPEIKGEGICDIQLDLTDKYLFEASRLIRRC